MGISDESPMRDLFPNGPAGAPPPRPAPLARHFYAIDATRVYSLRDAARALEMPEGNLRRAILLDQLRAIEVDDDRQYLLEGSALQDFVRRLRPTEQCAFPAEDSLLPDLLTFLIIPILIVLVLLFVRGPEAPRPDSAARDRAAPAATVSPDASAPKLEAPAPQPPDVGDPAALPNY
jgi:hypothetical protein